MRTPLTTATDVLRLDKWRDMVHVPMSLAEDIVLSRDTEIARELTSALVGLRNKSHGSTYEAVMMVIKELQGKVRR